MQTKTKLFFYSTGTENSHIFSQIDGKKYRYSALLVLCTRICILLVAFCLLALCLGHAKIMLLGSYYVPIYILGGLAVLLPTISMLFGKIRMVVNEEAIHALSETIPFCDIERIELWRSWWRYEYWVMIRKKKGHYFTSYLCIKMKDGSQKILEDDYICRNIIEINKHVPTNLILVSIREVLKDIILVGLLISTFLFIDYVGIENKHVFAFILYIFFIICNIILLIHHLWSMFLSRHFYKEYGLVVQIKALDIMEVILYCSAILACIVIYVSILI